MRNFDLNIVLSYASALWIVDCLCIIGHGDWASCREEYSWNERA